jgi:hypothetical protein
LPLVKGLSKYGHNSLGRVHTNECIGYQREVDEEHEYDVELIEPGEDPAVAL